MLRMNCFINELPLKIGMGKIKFMAHIQHTYVNFVYIYGCYKEVSGHAITTGQTLNRHTK